MRCRLTLTDRLCRVDLLEERPENIPRDSEFRGKVFILPTKSGKSSRATGSLKLFIILSFLPSLFIFKSKIPLKSVSYSHRLRSSLVILSQSLKTYLYFIILTAQPVFFVLDQCSLVVLCVECSQGVL